MNDRLTEQMLWRTVCPFVALAYSEQPARGSRQPGWVDVEQGEQRRLAEVVAERTEDVEHRDKAGFADIV